MTAKLWRVFVFAILIVAWLFCHSTFAYELVQTESKDFHLRSGATLSLILFSGNVEIHPWNKEEVQLSLRKWVTASNRQQAEDKMADLQVEYSQKEDFLEIRQLNREDNSYFANLLRKTGLKKEFSAQIDYALRVPARLQLRIAQHDGKMMLDSLTGNLNINQQSGTLELSSFLTDKLDLVLGDVQAYIRRVRGETSPSVSVTVAIDDGNLILQDSQLGTLMLRAQEADCYLVKNKIANGDMEIKEGDVFLNPLDVQESRYHIKSNKGDVYLLLPAEPNCAISLETSAGLIQSQFDWQIDKNASGCFLQYLTRNPDSGRIEVISDLGDIFIQKNWQALTR